MADKRMKAVVEYDDADDGNSEEGQKEDSDDLELGLSLAHPGIRAGFMGGGQREGHRRKNLPWEDLGVGSSQFGSPQEPLRQFDFGQGNVKDWVETDDCREDVVEAGSVSQVNCVSRDTCLEMPNSECQRFAQQKRRKLLASPEYFLGALIYLDALTCGHTKKNGVGTRGEKNLWESGRCSNPLSLKESNHKMDATFFPAEVTAATVAIDFIPLSSSYLEFRMDFSDDLLHLDCWPNTCHKEVVEEGRRRLRGGL
ncbi:hypothetical protein MUK42_20831 [Musa troglodytarum]|uniref:Uncharacterized protein n=1 Tax=Musa troglodytarum TaxID=320322 RepID=A0A9E7JG86_9LILI|nr:hypothetical protein MUK42_20831 [Musa troglodytarum]